MKYEREETMSDNQRVSLGSLTGAYEILPPGLAIKSMRSSGYRDTAHAIAELIDNSIQAGHGVNERTAVEVICVDRVEVVSQRQRRRIDRIGVYDNASGMDATTLRMALQFGNGTHLHATQQKGIGKFGMGLPNASISQCQRGEVWSWQDGKCLYTYLDVDDVEKGRMREVPEPTPSSIPPEWRRLIRDEIGPHGTLVVWTRLDRVSWKGSRALLENAEFLVGRMYRYFIQEKLAGIRLAAFEDKNGSVEPTDLDRDLRPNDPLYLMSGTNCPPPFENTPAFDALGDPVEVQVKYEGEEHVVQIRFSVVGQIARQLGGSSPIGKHAAKNQGVSLVRAKRELEMNHSFDNRYDPRERWWGVEVSFEPELDDVFGVTNNKQAATTFYQLDLDEDAKVEGLTGRQFYDQLEENGDPRLVIYDISNQIRRNLRTLREQIQRMMIGARRPGEVVAPPGSAEDIATRATKKRREQLGDRGRSDREEQKPAPERTAELAQELIAEGVDETTATQVAVQAVRSNIKFLFQDAEIPGTAFFDIKSKAGTIIVNINTRHPVSEHLFELLKANNTEPDPPTLKALKLLLTAWARLEDESGDARRQQLEDVRQDWGRLARDFLQEADD
jgi:hypothetical protein